MRILPIIIAALCFSFPLSAQVALTAIQKRALTSAIEDEIYDYGLESSFAYIGKSLDGDRQQVPLFLVKGSTSSSYNLIYRLMPYGEIFRTASVAADGTVSLSRNPEMGFTPETPDTLTEYYDDDLICDLKQKALRLSFIVEMHPSEARLKEAIRNQQKRYRFSHLFRSEKKQLNR